MARKKISHYVAKFVFRAICGLFIAGVIGILIWRMASSGDPKELVPLTPNEKLASAYAEDSEGFYAFTQKLDNITRTEYNNGYFSVNRAVFVDSADQLQFILRYNNSTLKNISEDLKIPEDSREDDVFDVVVTVMYDLTPENKDDNSGEIIGTVKRVQHLATSQKSAKKNLYNYKKYVFDGIKITDDVLAVYVDIYYNKDVKAAGTLAIYDYRYPKNDYKLTQNDIAGMG